MSPYRVFLDYFVPSCLFSSMSWVSSSTTACATTAGCPARAAGAVGPAVVELSMSSSRRSMRREISACGSMSSISKSLNALNTGSLNVTVVCPEGVIIGRVRSGAPDRGHVARAVVGADELSLGSAF
jgi:hypothetical protein